ncbi:hypothetical protein LX36DRAFT_742338, partial [Colletotrichum falcatum]
GRSHARPARETTADASSRYENTLITAGLVIHRSAEGLSPEADPGGHGQRCRQKVEGLLAARDRTASSTHDDVEQALVSRPYSELSSVAAVRAHVSIERREEKLHLLSHRNSSLRTHLDAMMQHHGMSTTGVSHESNHHAYRPSSIGKSFSSMSLILTASPESANSSAVPVTFTVTGDSPGGPRTAEMTPPPRSTSASQKEKPTKPPRSQFYAQCSSNPTRLASTTHDPGTLPAIESSHKAPMV